MISTIVKQIYSEYRINTSLGANPDNVPEFFWMDGLFEISECQ